MVSLIKLLEQSLLVEGRVEDVLKKYQGKITPETVNKFVSAQNEMDPSLNNKYLDWMVKQYINGSSADEIIKIVGIWHKNLNKMKPSVLGDAIMDYANINNPETDKMVQNIVKSPKDINAYPSLSILNDVAIELQNQKSQSEIDKELKGQTRIVYDDTHYRILIPLSVQSACKYGSGTRWCVAATKGTNHYKSQTRDGILFYVIDKMKSQAISNPLYKVAVLMNKTSGSVSIWNARDENIGDKLDTFFPPEMIEVMKNYRDKYVIDLGKLNAVVNARIGDIGGNIQGWELISNGKSSMLTQGSYYIQISVDLKEQTIGLVLTYADKTIAQYYLNIEGEIIKTIEDIMIETGGDTSQIAEWSKNLITTINQDWNEIMKTFQPNINSVEIHKTIESKLNKVTNNWRFTADSIPTESNRKSAFKSIRTIDVDGKDYVYTLMLVLDFMKNQFVFKSEEDQGKNQKEQYEDQIHSFPKQLINNPDSLIEYFLDWSEAIVFTAYDETWNEYVKPDDRASLNKIVGNYMSSKYGKFTVEIDDDDNIHVYSEYLGTHFLLRNIQAFNKTVVQRYQAKKVKK